MTILINQKEKPNLNYYKLGFEGFQKNRYFFSMSENEFYHATPKDAEDFNQGQQDAFHQIIITKNQAK